MSRRRSNGEGSIYKRPNGTWTAQISIYGRRLSRTFKTKRECQEWIRETHYQIGVGFSYPCLQITLGEYLANWQTNTKATMQRSTWKHYEQLIRMYVGDELKHTKLVILRTDQVQGLYTQLLNRDVGIYAIRKLHDALHSALEYAVKVGVIQRNPAALAKPPKAIITEIEILNENQVRKFLLAAKNHRWGALFHLAVITGMRQMELLGLKWTDLDWKRHCLKIERQLLRPDGGEVKFSCPKTRYGKRALLLGQRTIEILRNHKERQQNLRLLAKEEWIELGLIFTTNKGGPIHPRNLLREFKELLKNANLPAIRFHDLRHTAASILLNNGVPIINVSRHLGHARASITLDIYGHLIPSLQSEVAEMIDNLVMPIQNS